MKFQGIISRQFNKSLQMNDDKKCTYDKSVEKKELSFMDVKMNRINA